MKTTTLVLLSAIVLSACAPAAAPTPTATPIPPTSTTIPPTSTPIPPTATVPPPTATVGPTATPVPPTETPLVLVTSADMLVGNWQPLSTSRDAMFLQFNSDGTCRQSYSLDGLTKVPEVECTYTFEGTRLLITAVKLNGVPECPSPTGKYEVWLIADNQIRLRPAGDTCVPRMRSTLGSYQRNP